MSVTPYVEDKNEKDNHIKGFHNLKFILMPNNFSEVIVEKHDSDLVTERGLEGS